MTGTRIGILDFGNLGQFLREKLLLVGLDRKIANTMACGAVTGTATYDSFLASLKRAGGEGRLVFLLRPQTTHE